MIVAGTISKKMVPGIKTLYDQMPEPKWVMALGNCAISGGPFAFEGQYGIVVGADKFLPVDVYVPGCPPRPEALLEGIIELEHNITGWRSWPKVKPQWRGYPPKDNVLEAGAVDEYRAKDQRRALSQLFARSDQRCRQLKLMQKADESEKQAAG